MLKELSKHLEKKHKDESQVQKLMAKPKKDVSRRKGFIHLAKVGNYYHNCEVLKQRSGELILARVPTEEEKKMHTYSDYGPCPDYLAFMLKRHLWHHLAQSWAVKSNSGLRRRPLLECNTLLAHTYSKLHPSPDFNQYILFAFKTDDIALICKQDILIIKFGEMQFDKYHTTQAELIRQYRRQLARLVKELRKVDKPKLWLTVEKGEANRFKGKSLNEINICDLPEMENEAEGSDCEYAEKEDEKELDDIVEDVAHTSLTKSKNLSNPKVLKKKTPVRRCWSDKEFAAVLQFFRTSIKKGITPGKSLCTVH
ncbi:hypothetical protein RN001_005733 [Aquatica leii]|uniref:Uncharacterized protein n=1 Tax=Aquatica leii TaxID=1421715 RepID=A0AAN7PCR5_9COLE|nr:hypothetical protein RN001_005733 [Aquatica leii]